MPKRRTGKAKSLTRWLKRNRRTGRVNGWMRWYGSPNREFRWLSKIWLCLIATCRRISAVSAKNSGFRRLTSMAGMWIRRRLLLQMTSMSKVDIRYRCESEKMARIRQHHILRTDTTIFSAFRMSLLNDCLDIFLLSFIGSTNKRISAFRISYITYQCPVRKPTF